MKLLFEGERHSSRPGEHDDSKVLTEVDIGADGPYEARSERLREHLVPEETRVIFVDVNTPYKYSDLRKKSVIKE